MSVQDLIDAISYRPPWQKDAACRGMAYDEDPPNFSVFFPSKGNSAHPLKEICVHCSVQKECGDMAAEFHDRYGVWGGRSGRERRADWGDC